MSKLTKLLEYAHAGGVERKELANKPSFQKTVLDTVREDQKALLLSDELEESTVLQEQVLDTIIAGAERFSCMREFLPTYKCNTYSMRIVYQDDMSSFAKDIPEGGKIEIDQDSLAKTNINIKKIGTRPLITNELIEDALWDRVEIELKRAGARMENKFNKDGMTAMLSGTPKTVDASSDMVVKDLSKAIKEVKLRGFIPTDAMYHPDAEGELMQNDNILNYYQSGDSNLLRNGSIGTLLGLKSHLFSIETSGAPVKDWEDVNDSYYAWVGDPQAYCACAMRRDVAVEEYDDPIHDLLGIKVTMRYGMGKIQNDAGVFIVKKS